MSRARPVRLQGPTPCPFSHPPPTHATPTPPRLHGRNAVTFVGYNAAASPPGAAQQFWVFEPCGKCKNFQGGATTFLASLRFQQTGVPALSYFSWGHQVGRGEGGDRGRGRGRGAEEGTELTAVGHSGPCPSTVVYMM